MSFLRNYNIEKILRQWKTESNCKNSIHYWYQNGELLICSSECGKMIGYYGTLVYKYKEILKATIRDFEDVKFQEVNYHWI